MILLVSFFISNFDVAMTQSRYFFATVIILFFLTLFWGIFIEPISRWIAILLGKRTNSTLLLCPKVFLTRINISERNRGMDIHQLKQRIDASGKKLVTLGNEYIKSKDEIAARKVLVKMFGEISQQTLLLGEQNAQMDRNQKGLK